MKFLKYLTLIFCVVSGSIKAQENLAINQVALIDVNTGDVLHNQTVLVSDGVIQNLGPFDAIQIPVNYRVVNGLGKFLIPGLFDMHVHLSKMRASSMPLLVARGVTSVRDMGGDHLELLSWRGEVNSGERVGPRIFMAGPYLESKANITRQRNDSVEDRVEPVERTRIPVGSPEEGEEIISCLAKTELDFLKVRTTENTETLLAIGKAARENGLSLVGHVIQLSPENIIEAGFKTAEHTLFPLLDDLTPGERKQKWLKMKEAGVYMVPTLSAYFAGTFAADKDIEYLFSDDENTPDGMNYISKFLYIDWKEQSSERQPEMIAFFGRVYNAMKVNWLEMKEVGLPFMAGSDTTVLNLFPGDGLHMELELLVDELGLTPLEALQSATTIPAVFFGKGNELGSIEVGKKADLVLLRENPLNDISHVKDISGVVSFGKYYDEEGINSLLEQSKNHPDRKENDWIRIRGSKDRHQCMLY